MSSAVSSVSASDYLRSILQREAVGREHAALLARTGEKIAALCDGLVGRDVTEVTLAGGYEKGFANRSGISADYAVWFRAAAGKRMADHYNGLFEGIERLGLAPVRRDVSIAIDIGDMVVDLLPTKQLSTISDIHELYSTRRGRPLTTNLNQHLLDARSAGWQDEIRILKLWRDQNGLDLPSFYLELATVSALRRRPADALAENVWAVLGFIERLLVPRAMLDPANAANIVSDELNSAQKRAVAAAAAEARAGKPWSEIVR
ncbi:MAG: hypothetical protein ACO1OG_12070 [Devosia sp.]